MIKIKLDIHPIPKPCGVLMRGRIVMNPVKVLKDGTTYGSWKIICGHLARNQIFALNRATPLTPYGIIYNVFCPLARKDLSNCFESVQDALVEAEVIPDDAIKYLTKIAAFYTESQQGGYVIYICESARDWLNTLESLTVV